MTKPLVRQQIVERLMASPSSSNREIAQEVGADHKTVAAVRRELIASGAIPVVDRIHSRDGRARPARRLSSRVSAAIGGVIAGVARGVRTIVEAPPRKAEDAPASPYATDVICPRCECRDMRLVLRRFNLGREVHVRQCRHCGRRRSFIVRAT